MNPEPSSLLAVQMRLTSLLASALYSKLDRKRINEVYTGMTEDGRNSVDAIFALVCGRSLDVLLKFSEIPDVVDSSHELPDVEGEDC